MGADSECGGGEDEGESEGARPVCMCATCDCAPPDRHSRHTRITRTWWLQSQRYPRGGWRFRTDTSDLSQSCDVRGAGTSSSQPRKQVHDSAMRNNDMLRELEAARLYLEEMQVRARVVLLWRRRWWDTGQRRGRGVVVVLCLHKYSLTSMIALSIWTLSKALIYSL